MVVEEVVVVEVSLVVEVDVTSIELLLKPRLVLLEENSEDVRLVVVEGPVANAEPFALPLLVDRPVAKAEPFALPLVDPTVLEVIVQFPTMEELTLGSAEGFAVSVVVVNDSLSVGLSLQMLAELNEKRIGV